MALRDLAMYTPIAERGILLFSELIKQPITIRKLAELEIKCQVTVFVLLDGGLPRRLALM
jgi:hypothetical protein